MKEHRLIELMIKNIKEKVNSKRAFDSPAFTEVVVDFFRTYADRCHHGKEEDILFKELSKKPLSEEHKDIMNELINEHAIARTIVKRLEKAINMHGKSGIESRNEISLILSEIVMLYPPHIEKEDNHFFYPVMEYFRQQELDAMLQEFREFDARMIHEKYENLTKSL
jgi:hemerythrin-like domain-containing protein